MNPTAHPRLQQARDTRHGRWPRGLITALLVCSAAASAAPGSAPVERSGAGPYFRLSLPQALHSAAQSAELDDLRVLDAKGLPLPWAWAPEPSAEVSSRRRAVTLFPLPHLSQPGASVPTQITLRPDGTVQWKGGRPASNPSAPADTWLIDTHDLGGNLVTLTLRWADSGQGVFPLRLEASDDLQHWQTVSQDAAVLKLQQAGQTLTQDSLALDGLRARYLRLQWLGTPLALQSAEVEHLTTAVAPPPALQWTSAWPPSQCDATGCTWVMPPHLPLDALRLDLAQPNTVAQVRLFGENRATPPVRRHRHPLQLLHHRHRSADDNNSSSPAPRQALWDGVLWRLSLPDASAQGGQGESRQAILPLDGTSHERLRLEARSATSEWGSTPPTLALGTRRRDILFLARDPGPVTLAWGNAQAPGQPLPVAQLMPLGERSPVSPAQVSVPALAPPAVMAVAAASGVTAQDTRSGAGSGGKDPANMPWLWAVLIGGLGLLGGMAYSLLKNTQRADH